MPESIADQLGLVDARADPLAATIEYASSGPMLLVIDNVEHVDAYKRLGDTGWSAYALAF